MKGFRRHSRWHFRWHSRWRRVVLDTHDLRFGVFWVKGESAYLHLPGVIILMKEGV